MHQPVVLRLSLRLRFDQLALFLGFFFLTQREQALRQDTPR